MIERALKVDLVPEVEQQEQHLIGDPAEEEAGGDRQHRPEYTSTGAFLEDPIAVAVPNRDGGDATRYRRPRRRANRVHFGAQFEHHQQVGREEKSERDEELHQ